MKTHIDLDGAWQFAWSDSLPAQVITTITLAAHAGLTFHPCTVPGNLETDLMALGRLPDPFMGMNITGLRALERLHLWYGRTFIAEDKPDCLSRLVFNGVDCYADYYLNGNRIGSSDNMLVEHVFDVTGRLRGENEILIHIRPTVVEAAKYEYTAQQWAFPGNYDSLHVRKAPHMFGWDIMPRAVSAGLWRPVTLDFVPRDGIEEIHLRNGAVIRDSTSVGMNLFIRARLVDPVTEDVDVEIEGECGSSTFKIRQPLRFVASHVEFTIAGPQLWWPRGYGEQSLYAITVRLYRQHQLLDERALRYGIRTIELDRTELTTDDGQGEFCFKVNGEKIFAKGTNWTPLDPFHSRDHDKIRPVMDMVADLTCNMIRCWGGNVYEDDLFFDLCDEQGVLIWQDFAMACGIYPQDDLFAARLGAEARKVVRRLRHHPSLALWAGDNECDAMQIWKSRGNPNTNRLTRHVLPDVIRDEDGTRPYLPSSHYVSEAVYQAGMEYIPEDHIWGPRLFYKGDFYMNVKCHFASEIGYHGCPPVKSLEKFISKDKLWPYGNDQWRLHMTDPVPGLDQFGYLVELMRKQHQQVFGRFPDTLEEFVWADQVKQAEAFKFFIERFRAQKWRRTGIIWWNLWDGCPETSNALVDYYWEKKLAYDVVKRAQQDPCVILCEPVDGSQAVVIANDTCRSFRVRFTVTDADTGETRLRGEAVAAANATTPAGSIPWAGRAPHFYVARWDSEAGPGVNHHMSGEPPFDAGQYRRWMEHLQ